MAVEQNTTELAEACESCARLCRAVDELFSGEDAARVNAQQDSTSGSPRALSPIAPTENGLANLVATVKALSAKENEAAGLLFITGIKDSAGSLVWTGTIPSAFLLEFVTEMSAAGFVPQGTNEARAHGLEAVYARDVQQSVLMRRR